MIQGSENSLVMLAQQFFRRPHESLFCQGTHDFEGLNKIEAYDQFKLRMIIHLQLQPNTARGSPTLGSRIPEQIFRHFCLPEDVA